MTRLFWSTRRIRRADLQDGDVFVDLNGDWSNDPKMLGYYGPLDLIEIQVPESAEPASSLGASIAYTEQAVRDSESRSR